MAPLLFYSWHHLRLEIMKEGCDLKKINIFRLGNDFLNESKMTDSSEASTSKMDRPLETLETSDAYSLLECPVCLERLTVPVTSTCSNGHAVCNTCKSKVNLCPCCRTPMRESKNILIDRVIEVTLFPCKHKLYGCEMFGKYKDIVEHETRECDYKNIPCSLLNDDLEKCGKSVMLRNFHNHILKEHANLLEKITTNEGNVRKICSTNHEFFKIQKILQDSEEKLIFLETCFYDKHQGIFFLGYQYVGGILDSKKYMCTTTLYDPYDKLKKLKYMNVCLPIGVPVNEMHKDSKCLVIHPDKVIRIKEGMVEVNHIVKIEKIEHYESRKSKRIKLESQE